MVDKNEQSEPTMEEILASIRRIISEENSAEGADSAAPAAASSAVGAQANGRAQPKSAAEPGLGPDLGAEDDVLELTEMVAEDEAPAAPAGEEAVEVAFEAVAAAQPDLPSEAEPIQAPEPEPAFEPEPAPISSRAEKLFVEAEGAPENFARPDDKTSDWEAPIDPADEEDAIMSDSVSDETRAAFQNLSDLLVAGYQGSDNTLEAMVRTMLKPMLKSWLDENLPAIVERVVAREVARLARAKRP